MLHCCQIRVERYGLGLSILCCYCPLGLGYLFLDMAIKAITYSNRLIPVIVELGVIIRSESNLNSPCEEIIYGSVHLPLASNQSNSNRFYTFHGNEVANDIIEKTAQ